MGLTRITSDGITDGTITGTDLATNVDLVDDQKLRIGTGNDLLIWHGVDGSENSYITQQTSKHLIIKANSALQLRADTLNLWNHNQSKRYIACTNNSSVDLYYDNSKKFETTSSGVKVTDAVLEIADTTCLIDLMETGATDSNHRLRNGSGNFLIQKISDDKNTTTTQFDIDGGTGVVSLYHNGTKKFETAAGGVITQGYVSIQGGSNGQLYVEDNGKVNLGTSQDLQIYHDGSNSYIKNLTGWLNIPVSNNGVSIANSDFSESIARFLKDGACELYNNGSKKLETVSGGVNITGNLGIGDTTPSYTIEAKAAEPIIRLEETSTGGSKRLDLGVTSNGQSFIGANQSSQSIQIETSGSRRFTFGTSEMFTAENGTDFSWSSNPGHVIYQSGEYRSTTANGTHIRCNRINGDGHVAQWYRGSSNMVGFISISSSGTSYGSGSSDERTKKNIEDWSESVLSKFKSLTPKLFNFNWEDDTAVKHKGYIAQNEVDKFPEAYPKNNLTDCDDEFYTFTPTDMTVYLMKGLKEAAEKIEILETKVAALEAS